MAGRPEADTGEDRRGFIPPWGHRLVVLWGVGLVILYVAGGYLGSRQLERYRAETESRRVARLATNAPDAGASSAAATPGSRPVDVHVDVHVNRVSDVSLKESGWTADFDIRFRWTGAALSPGETFDVVNGEIRRREKRETSARGNERSERYHVTARVEKFFDPLRFPFGDEGLIIQVQDRTHGVDSLRYVADGQGLSGDALPRSLRVTRALAVTRLQHSGAGTEDPTSPARGGTVHSRYVMALLVVPHSSSIFVTMFQALFASVAIALVALFIKPIHVDPRFGLGIGAFFAAVGNNLYASTLLPAADRITLTAMINAVGLLTIFLTVLQSTISLYLFDSLGRERLSRVFDRVSFAVLLLGYTAVTLALPLAATP